MSENNELLFPTATKEDVTRANIKLQVAQSYRLIDTTDEILKAEGGIDPNHVVAVVSAFKQQLEEMTTLISIQNEITVGEFEEGVHALAHFYEEQLQQIAEEMVKQQELTRG